MMSRKTGVRMKVYLPGFSGFCPGVKLAEKKIFAEKQEFPEKQIYILGHLIHNSNYIEFLENNGVHTIEDLEYISKRSSVVVRTHGMDKSIQQEVEKDFEVLDLTCYKVKKLQMLIEEHARDGFFVFISGKKDHPEMQGLVSYADAYFIIEDAGDLEKIENWQKGQSFHPEFEKYNKVLLISQTTGSLELFRQSEGLLRGVFEATREIKVIDSICSITSRREEEALEIQKGVDLTVVVGDEMSSNANKLYKILKQKSENTWFVPDLKHLQSLGLDLTGCKTAQVVSSSSTPEFVESEIVQWLENQ